MDRLVAWAREEPANERAFWAQVYPKLLPLQVSGSLDMKHTLLETLKAGRADAE